MSLPGRSWAPTRPQPDGGRRVGLAALCAGVALLVSVVWPLLTSVPVLQRLLVSVSPAQWFANGAVSAVVLGAALAASLLTRVPFAGTVIAAVPTAVLSLLGLVALLIRIDYSPGAEFLGRQLLQMAIYVVLTTVPFVVLDLLLLTRRLPGLTPVTGAVTGAAVGVVVGVLTVVANVLQSDLFSGRYLVFVLGQAGTRAVLLTVVGALVGAAAPLLRRADQGPRQAPAPQWGTGPGYPSS